MHMEYSAGVVCVVLWGPFFLGLPVWAAVRKECVSRSGLGWSAVDGESPVGENMFSVVMGSRVAAGSWNLL